MKFRILSAKIMPVDRFFIEKTFVPESIVVLEEQESHHLLKVMRIQISEKVELVNGKNQLAFAELISVEKKRASLKILEIFEGPLEKHYVILAQGLPKLNRLENILEKCTELGVNEFILFPGELSEKTELSEQQLIRLQTIVISAMKQCGRLILPKITVSKALKHWNSSIIEEKSAFFGDVEPNAPLLREKLSNSKSPFLLFIGPEAGFSEKETKLLQSWHVGGVKLHSNILRTDTAAIASATIIHHFFLEN